MFIVIFKTKASIKKEVFYLAALFSILMLIVYGFIFSISLFDISIETAESSVKETNMQISIFTEGYFAEITNTIEALAEYPDIKNIMTSDEEAKERALTIYENFSNTNDNIAYIYSGYENGLLLINDYTPPEGYDPTDRPWYIAAVEEMPETSIGLPYQEANTEEWLISQSKVLLDSQGNHSGVIAIDCSLESIVSLMSEKHLYDSQRSYLLNPEGKVIVHPDEKYIGQTVPVIMDELTGSQGNFTYTSDSEKWAYYNTIDSTDWILITTVERWEMLKPLVTHFVFYTLSIILMAIFLGWAQSKIFGKRITEPLEELGTRIAEIADGKPRNKTAYKFLNQEIEKIADNIEQLAEHSLKKKANELEAIIESTGDGILVLDDKRQVIYMNSRFREMWSIPDNVEASGDDQVFINTIINQLNEPDTFMEKLQETYSSDQSYKDTLYCKGGRIFELFSRPLIDGGHVTGRLWSFSDVTYNKQAEEKLRIMATTDELTGLWNRRYFMQAARQEVERARRYDHSLSLIVFDVDHFKKVNDTRGHAAGDAALQHLASLMKKSLRDIDIPGRLGGEEFGILLPNTELNNAALLAERLRKTIEDSPADFKGSEIFLTVSIGVTAYQKRSSSVDELLKTADEALYEAKGNGRNCTVKKL